MGYDYRKAVRADILAAIENDRLELTTMSSNELVDKYWYCDQVTGNASGSYTFNTYQAEEYLCHNWGILWEAAKEFGYDAIDLEKGAEFWDVTIRCYVLMEVARELCED